MPDLSPTPALATPDCSVVELRQYTLHPGRRDTLIELFDREFVETQEAVGMRVIGQFRDLDDADRFVWLRGFADMASRGAALPAFYGGPAWAAHRDAANATMVDSDDVLLLRPVQALASADRRGTVQGAGCVRGLVVHLGEPAGDALLAAWRSVPAGDARWQACYVTEAAANNFPRLPVREGEPVLVALAAFAGAASAEAWAQALDARLQPWQRRPSQHLRLSATARSALQP